MTSVGAFLDGGLVKDLLVPYREQLHPMEAGRSYLVHIYAAARGGRLVASSRVERFISGAPPPYKPGQPVELLIAGPTDLGYKAIVEHAHWGLLFRGEVSEQLGAGQKVRGYIKQVRPDAKTDLGLHRPGEVPTHAIPAARVAGGKRSRTTARALSAGRPGSGLSWPPGRQRRRAPGPDGRHPPGGDLLGGRSLQDQQPFGASAHAGERTAHHQTEPGRQ